MPASPPFLEIIDYFAISIQLDGGAARVDFIDPTRLSEVDVLNSRSRWNEYRQQVTLPYSNAGTTERCAPT